MKTHLFTKCHSLTQLFQICETEMVVTVKIRFEKSMNGDNASKKTTIYFHAEIIPVWGVGAEPIYEFPVKSV